MGALMPGDGDADADGNPAPGDARLFSASMAAVRHFAASTSSASFSPHRSRKLLLEEDEGEAARDAAAAVATSLSARPRTAASVYGFDEEQRELSHPASLGHSASAPALRLAQPNARSSPSSPLQLGRSGLPVRRLSPGSQPRTQRQQLLPVPTGGGGGGSGSPVRYSDGSRGWADVMQLEAQLVAAERLQAKQAKQIQRIEMERGAAGRGRGQAQGQVQGQEETQGQESKEAATSPTAATAEAGAAAQRGQQSRAFGGADPLLIGSASAPALHPPRGGPQFGGLLGDPVHAWRSAHEFESPAHRPTVSVQAAYAQSAGPLQIPLAALISGAGGLRHQQQSPQQQQSPLPARAARTPYALKLQERLAGGARSRSSLSAAAEAAPAAVSIDVAH
jgi:hypothetical protein